MCYLDINRELGQAKKNGMCHLEFLIQQLTKKRHFFETWIGNTETT